MQLGRKLAEGYALDPEADEAEQPVVDRVAEERPEPEHVEQPVRV
jgi:hypothetical protein